MKGKLIFTLAILSIKVGAEDLSEIWQTQDIRTLQQSQDQWNLAKVRRRACDLQRKSYRLPFACSNQVEFERSCRRLVLKDVDLSEINLALKKRGLSRACRQNLLALQKIRRYQRADAGADFEMRNEDENDASEIPAHLLTARRVNRSGS